MTDRVVKPTDTGRSMALGVRDPRARRDSVAQSTALQNLREPGPGASVEDLRVFVGQLLQVLKGQR